MISSLRIFINIMSDSLGLSRDQEKVEIDLEDVELLDKNP